MNSNPLVLCGLFIFAGIILGVFIALIGQVILQDPEVGHKKEDFPFCYQTSESVISFVFTNANAFL